MRQPKAHFFSQPSVSFRRLLSGLRLLPLVVALAVLAACDPVRRDNLRNLHAVGAEVLRRDAATFYKDLFVAPGSNYFQPGNEKCPESFRRMQPLRVRAYPDGFALTIAEKAGREEGIYIVPLHMEAVPQPSGTATFERLEEGVYWYRFKEK